MVCIMAQSGMGHGIVLHAIWHVIAVMQAEMGPCMEVLVRLSCDMQDGFMRKNAHDASCMAYIQYASIARCMPIGLSAASKEFCM
jgi:hypothetical protein